MSTLTVTTLSNGSVSVPTATVVNGSAKAWGNWEDSGTPTIQDSFNHSSITDNSTGDYTMNFISAMSNSLFSGSTQSDAVFVSMFDDKTTTSVRCRMYNSSFASADRRGVYIVVGKLA